MGGPITDLSSIRYPLFQAMRQVGYFMPRTGEPVFDISWHFPPRTRIVLGCRPLSVKVNGICDPCPVQISHNGRHRVRLHARGGDERDVIRSGGRFGGRFEGDLVYNVRISGECGSCARGALRPMHVDVCLVGIPTFLELRSVYNSG